MNEDLIIMKLIKIEEKLDTFATKSELREYKDEVAGWRDEMTTMIIKHDQEMQAVYGWLHRHDDELEVHGKDIQRLKTKLIRA